MNKFKFFYFTVFFLLLFSFLKAANTPKLTKVPGWVTALELPVNSKVNERKITEGFYYLLSSRQINIQTEETYAHYAVKVVNNVGVQNASEINISFDPAYETISFHFIRIKRNDEVINKYKEKEFKVIQREDNLESKIYDGSLTAYLSLSDIRLGDIIEYSYTIKGRNPIFNNKYFTTFDMAYSSPVAIIYNKIVSPSNRKLNFKTLGKLDIKPVITTQNNLISYEWKTNCNEPLDFEENVPTTYNPFPIVDITEYNSWEEVVNWGTAIYQFNSPISKKLKNRIEELTKDKASIDDKIVAIFRFVQNEIRYMGFEIGVNSHQPHEPNKVFENRFGDCKDKAYLFCRMLKEIGVNAYPNLVNTYTMANVTNVLPSPGHFNHVTVCVELNNLTYWLDPTSSHQGGNLNSIQYVNYGYTLVIKPGMKELTKINLTNALRKITTKEIFTYKNLETPIDLVVTTRYEGVEADDARYKFETNSKADIEKSYIDFYSRLYKTTNLIGEINVKDDIENNVFITFEQYELPEMQIEEGGQKQLQIYHDALLGNLTIPKSIKRDYPYAINNPYHYIQKIIIKMPEHWNFSPENSNISNDYFDYNYNTYFGEDENSFELNYEFKTKTNEVSVLGMNAYVKDLEEVNKFNIYQVILTDTKNTTSENVATQSNSTGLMVAIALIILVLSIFLLNKLYKFDVKPLYPDHNMEIGGWLVLSLIGVLVAPFIGLFNLFKGEYFGISILTFFTSGSTYSPLAGIFVVLEMICLIVMISFQVLLIILFVKKRSSLPRLIIINYIGVAAFYLMEIIFLNVINPSDSSILNEIYGAFAKVLISGAIWIPYYLKSERVKETFVVTYYLENEYKEETAEALSNQDLQEKGNSDNIT
jgi:transglutaminase-like putative cysteine protease